MQDRRAFLTSAAAVGALMALAPVSAIAATIPQPERVVACDNVLLISGEDSALAGHFLDFLQTAFPGFDWSGILRTRARLWQPYIASGLSIDAFIDEAIRYAAVFAYSRT